MPDIVVRRVEGDSYSVEVREGESSTRHLVTVSAADLEEFGGSSPERLVEESFRFLLEREPKESILSRFELPTITMYFPDFPRVIRRRLG